MIGREKMLDFLDQAIASVPRSLEVEVSAQRIVSNVARFSQSQIHQNMDETNSVVYVRARNCQRLGVAVTNAWSVEGVTKAIEKSAAISKTSPPLDFLSALPECSEYPEIKTFDNALAGISATDKQRVLKELFDEADQQGVTFSGIFSTEEVEMAVANSAGLRAWQPYTKGTFDVAAFLGEVSGCATVCSRRLADIDGNKVGGRALEKCRASVNPRPLPPGRYNVILEPRAVAELLFWLDYIGFGANTLKDKTSFIADNIGKRIMSEKISIYDDGLDPSGVPMVFDFEGVPKRKTHFIEQGVARGVVHDTLTAARDGAQTTGHAMPPNFEWGPMAINLFIGNGSATKEELLKSIGSGLLVSRLHYINGLLDTRRALFTGMTRDGTFWVENGEVQYPVENLRFTESMLDAFSRVLAVSKETETIDHEMQVCVVPSIAIEDFQFTGKTTF